MRKLIFTLCLFLTTYLGYGQIAGCYFDEDFESATDSVTSASTTGLGGFFHNTRLFTSSTTSDSATVVSGDITTLTTVPVDVSAYTYIILSFKHICKVDFFDHAYLFVQSPLFGINDTLKASDFLDTLQNYQHYLSFQNQGNSFNEASWGGDWLPGQVVSPDSSWWRTETFNLSNYAGLPDLQVTFQLEDANNPGGNSRAGWFIDDICIQAAPCELTPPTIIPINPLQGVAYSLGPYNTTWSINDNTGIDFNTVYLYWTVNGGALDSTLMSYDAGSNLFVGQIPAVNDSDTICYYASANDISACANYAIYPASGCIQFVATIGIGFPYCDGFDNPPPLWLDSASLGTPWELGVPTTGTPGAALSPPNVWEVGLNTVYAASSNSTLYSLPIDFSGAVNATLSVWLNYSTEQGWDGTRLEYTTDQGVTWNVLGTLLDPNGVNWYNQTANCNGIASWTGNSFNVVGNVNGWYKAEYDLGSAGLNNQPIVQFRFHFCSDQVFQIQGFAIDNFCIILPSPQDAGVTQIVQPGAQGAAGVCLPIIVTIKNFGTQSITSTNVSYNLNGVIHGPFVWNGVLLPGQSVNDTLPCDTIPIGLNSICAWTDLLNDGNLLNDSLCGSTFGFPVITPSACDDFESGSQGWYSTPTTGFSSWQLGTPAFGATTGAHSGTNAWDVDLTTAYPTGALDTLYTPIYDITPPGVINPYISFWQNRNTTLSQDGFWIEYTTNSGNSWSTLGSTTSVATGDAIGWYNDPNLNFSNQSDWGGNSNGWVKSTFFLQSVLPATPSFIQFRFIFTSSQFGIPLDGVSIDDFCMTQPPPDDAGVIITSSATGAFSQPVGQQDSLSITIRNFGTNPITSVNIFYQINGGGTIYGPYNWTGNLTPGFNSTPFILAGFPYTIPSGGYTVCAWTDLTGDGDHANDTSCVNLVGVPVINVFDTVPYCDNFDGGNIGWYNELQPGGNNGSNWELGTPAFGVTTGAHTPPNAWDINLTTAYTNNADVALVTPFFNIPPGSNPYIQFWHKWNTETNWDGVRLEYSASGGPWTQLGIINDPNGTNWYTNIVNCSAQPAWAGNSSNIAGSTNGWVFSKIRNLNFLSGNVQFRFIFCSDASVIVEGYSIDDFCCKIPPPIDGGVSAVTSFAGLNVSAGINDSVTVSISNYGSGPISNFPVYFSANGTTYGPYTYVPTILPGNTVTNVVLSGLGLTYPVDTGANALCAWTEVLGDGDHTNDTTCGVVNGFATFPIDYAHQFCDDFDGVDNGYGPQLLNGGNSNTVWELGFPNFGATIGAHTPPNAWDINLNTGYTTNGHAALYTPIYTIPASANPYISFWQNCSTSQFNDGVTLEYTDDGGVTWTGIGAIGSINATNWYTTNIFCANSNFAAWTGNSNGWIQSTINNLTQLNGKTVQFRFRFCSGAFTTGDGFSIDDFCVNVPNPLTITPTNIANNGVGFCIFPGQCVDFNTNIKNLGTTPVNGAYLTLTIDGVPQSIDTAVFASPINLNASAVYTFNNCWTATQGTHTICVYTSMPNGLPDLNPTDDSICIAITVCDSINMTNGSQYCSGFESGSNTWVTTQAVNFSNQTSWEQGTVAKTHIAAPFAGNNCWVTKLTGQYPPNDKSALFTPLFILSPNTSYKVSFEANYKAEIFQDGGTFEWSNDFGTFWHVLGNQNDPNWMNTFSISAMSPGGVPLYPGWTGTSTGATGWEHKEHQVCFAGISGEQYIIFRFRFYSDLTVQDEGWAIDNFCLTPDPSTQCTVGLNDIAPVATINLSQNFPNPAQEVTSFIYSIPENGKVLVKITDLLGRIIDIPTSENQTEGTYKVTVNTLNYSPGIYYYSLQWKDQIIVRKMLITGK